MIKRFIVNNNSYDNERAVNYRSYLKFIQNIIKIKKYVKKIAFAKLAWKHTVLTMDIPITI